MIPSPIETPIGLVYALASRELNADQAENEPASSKYIYARAALEIISSYSMERQFPLRGLDEFLPKIIDYFLIEDEDLPLRQLMVDQICAIFRQPTDLIKLLDEDSTWHSTANEVFKHFKQQKLVKLTGEM